MGCEGGRLEDGRAAQVDDIRCCTRVSRLSDAGKSRCVRKKESHEVWTEALKGLGRARGLREGRKRVWMNEWMNEWKNVRTI